jgi:hypothetical protein
MNDIRLGSATTSSDGRTTYVPIVNSHGEQVSFRLPGIPIRINAGAGTGTSASASAVDPTDSSRLTIPLGPSAPMMSSFLSRFDARIYNYRSLYQISPPKPIISLTDYYYVKKNKDHSECTICLEDYIIDDYINIFKCGHFFHKTCVIELQKATSFEFLCPLCRSLIVNADMVPKKINKILSAFSSTQPRPVREEDKKYVALKESDLGLKPTKTSDKKMLYQDKRYYQKERLNKRY